MRVRARGELSPGTIATKTPGHREEPGKEDA
jgi:hypothetical protein